jgi:hypothetical protein
MRYILHGHPSLCFYKYNVNKPYIGLVNKGAPKSDIMYVKHSLRSFYMT